MNDLAPILSSTQPASRETGLTSVEAARRLAQFRPNEVPEEKVNPVIRVLRHFWAPVPWMLEGAIALQALIGERVEAAMIATLLLLNVALGIFQETRANATLDLLKQRLAPHIRPRRDDAWVDVPAASAVSGGHARPWS
ncbi:MAG TPA: cation-transporting P-type ATPase [Dongiaceae bacterium]|nr:cation-transporting P-type ATPase [Dongiaceae bacterium]